MVMRNKGSDVNNRSCSRSWPRREVHFRRVDRAMNDRISSRMRTTMNGTSVVMIHTMMVLRMNG
jgi:hypothetical protein